VTRQAAGLQAELRRLRRVDNLTNLGYIAGEYICLAIVMATAILFAESRASFGLAWTWNLPVFGLAVVLIGAIQHRLAGLGHEAGHYTLLRNKLANDLVGDLFCLFPVLATVHFYRLFHLAHHQYANDPDRDPDIVNMGLGRGVDAFPMPRWRIVLTYYLRALALPFTLLRYESEYIYVNTLGKGGNVYMRRVPDGDGRKGGLRLGTLLGLAYLVGFVAVQWWLTTTGQPLWLVPAGVIGMVLATVVTYALPDWAIFQSPFRQAYSTRFAGVLRLGYFTALLVALGLLRPLTGGHSSTYFWTLWVLPMVTWFSFFLFLRDVYQHTNADAGRFTNTRVFFCDPFTRWAVFVYGQDMHLPHHLFPAVPHYRLGELHEFLRRHHPEYAAQAVECHGTFANRHGGPTILGVLSQLHAGCPGDS
jgi:fatty acid desaturase